MKLLKSKPIPLRYKVKRTLEDITWALKNHPMVIFIDDLDRCPSEQVLKVLEFVNFLSSDNLKSYIVLGMDLDKVLPSISGEFSSIVEESLKEEDEKEDEEVRRKRLKEERQKYAQNYLEKLVNIEVNVPKANPEELADLAEQNTSANKDETTRQDKWDWAINFFDRKLFPLILTGLFAFSTYIAASYYSALNSKEFTETRKQQKKTEKALKQTKIEIKNSRTILDKLGNTFDETDKNIEELKNVQKLLKEQSLLEKNLESQIFFTENNIYIKKKDVDVLLSNWAVPMLYLLIFIFASFALFILFSRKKEIDDDPIFIKALKIWSPVITYYENTPRHFKRSVNQLRLMAMRGELKGEASDIRNLVVLKALKELGIGTELKNTNPILTIGNVSFIEGLANSSHEEPMVQNPFGDSFIPLQSDHAKRALSNALAKHHQEFNGTWPGEKDIDAFEKLTRGIVLR
ncbi:MAG: hypothetical protein HOK41_14070 [Nitrospina sp.]|nr:hypothetical protein [Nitrospina sp.]MBT6716121.1 hypothetical protein [Nitrospina sp.]